MISEKLIFGKKLVAVAALVVAFQACKKDDESPIASNEDEEMITTVQLKLVNQSNTNDIVMVKWEDLDGDGGKSPSVENLSLKTNTTYAISFTKIENASSSPTSNILQEIEDEAVDHRFIFTCSKNDVSISELNKDSNNKAFGSSAVLKTGSVGTGTLNVILKHLPTNKDASTAAEVGGGTDLNIDFLLSVE